MASREPLEAKAVWQTSAARLTAVAVSVREGHSIAFLGDSKGTLHKVAHPWLFSLPRHDFHGRQGDALDKSGLHHGDNRKSVYRVNIKIISQCCIEAVS